MYKCILLNLGQYMYVYVLMFDYERETKPDPQHTNQAHSALSACQFSCRRGESEALLSMIRYHVPLAMSATDM